MHLNWWRSAQQKSPNDVLTCLPPVSSSHRPITPQCNVCITTRRTPAARYSATSGAFPHLARGRRNGCASNRKESRSSRSAGEARAPGAQRWQGRDTGRLADDFGVLRDFRDAARAGGGIFARFLRAGVRYQLTMIVAGERLALRGYAQPVLLTGRRQSRRRVLGKGIHSNDHWHRNDVFSRSIVKATVARRRDVPSLQIATTPSQFGVQTFRRQCPGGCYLGETTP
ncbi:hypothetical protein BV20DRAFT_375509 [Pilatotrama ljubarskyi]|nr:hypothetical protein BV20DRAFT_375509 [Pilatotrama ljubarskyi]